VTVDHERWPLPGRATPTSPVWQSPEFEAEMAAWCAEVLDSEVRLVPHKVRFWSAVWRVETAGGVYYAKQNCPGQAFEAALLSLLGRLSERVVPVTASDDTRGFLLTPDQGSVLGETVGDSLDVWVDVAREGALLQRELVDHLGELEGAGCTRLGPAEAATYAATRVEQYAALPEGDRRRLTGEQARAVRDLLPDVERWADQLLALGLPLSLNHSDLHEHNVFAVDGRLRFFDFGDAVVSDPLTVLLTSLRELDCGEDDPRIARVADSALEVWSDLAPMTELRAALPAALQLGKLARCESWVRCLPSVTDDEDERFGDAATFWIRFLAASPFEPFD
jgi:hypothetical protein